MAARTLEDYLKEFYADIDKNVEDNKRRIFNISYENFCKLLIAKGTYILKIIRKKNEMFLINNKNEDFIKYCYNWLTGSAEFKGNLENGILVCGAWGVGKTLILKAFVSVYNDSNFHRPNFDKNILTIHAPEFNEIYKKEGYSFFNKPPLFIDDLGKESQLLKDYANEVYPMQKTLMMRDEYGSLTFATSNLKKEDLKKLYTGTVADRFEKMFNIFEIENTQSLRN